MSYIQWAHYWGPNLFGPQIFSGLQPPMSDATETGTDFSGLISNFSHQVSQNAENSLTYLNHLDDQYS